MGFFQRIKRIFKANINDMLSKAEDPEKILEQLIIDMREQLQDAKRQVAVAIADEKRLKKQLDTEVEQSASWEKKAMRAIQLGDDELAKEALARKGKHDELVVEYQKQWELQKGSVDKLKLALQQLNEKIEEAQRKKNLLIARQKRAKAEKAIQETMTGLTDKSAFAAMDRMTEKIEKLEAESEAYAELNHELEDLSVEDKFKALEDKHSDQDEALAALKAKMGIVPGGKEKAKEKERVREKVLEREDESW